MGIVNDFQHKAEDSRTTAHELRKYNAVYQAALRRRRIHKDERELYAILVEWLKRNAAFLKELKSLENQVRKYELDRKTRKYMPRTNEIYSENVVEWK